MSFRYTNNLVGVLKHRLLLEAAHRECVRRTFTGQCNGIAVTCTGYGTVLRIHIVDAERALAAHTTRDAAATTTTATTTTATQGQAMSLDLQRLSTSIRAAVWAAVSSIASAKRTAHHRALADNAQLQSRGRLEHWYEHDATTMPPRPCDALKQELATSWMQAIRFGKANAAQYLAQPDGIDDDNDDNEDKSKDDGNDDDDDKYAPTASRPRRRVVRVLDAHDCSVAALPISAAYELYAPSLWQLEQHDDECLTTTTTTTTTTHAHMDDHDEEQHSRVDARAVRCEYKAEMARDEQLFWERVELIRRAQLATIPGGVKRAYAEQASTVIDTTDEKVELRFKP